MSDETKKEGKRVSRMIKFVQEPSLSLVAGEWVLARFSGVPGARWFLCYLDMGSSGRDLYGHRIATDEINFRNASPELGLMKYWESYIMRKKYLLCSMLQKLVEGQDWASRKDEARQDLTSMITSRANQGIAMASNLAGANNSSSNDKKMPDNNKIIDDDSGSDSDSDSHPASSSNWDTITETLKDMGGLAMDMASAGLAQKYYQSRAARLEKRLTADVLSTFPVHMQAALQSLDDNRDLMPSMFHSGKRIHMF